MSTEKILKGMLIVNGFLKGEKYSLVEEYLIKEAALQNIELFVQTNTNLLLNIRNNNFSQLKTKLKDNNFIIFWDKDIFLAKSLEQLGFKVFNNSFSIENCDDKRRTHFILAKNKINSPQSIFAPFTFENIGYNSNEYLKYIEKDLKYPIIIKEAFGSFGMQVYKSYNTFQTIEIIKKIGAKPFIFQKNINSLTTVEKLNNINNHKNAKLLVDKAGDVSFDVRICVVGERVVASMIRYSLNKDFRANLTNGGKMISYNATDEEQKLAIDVCKALSLDFGGVDLIYDENGIYVCEVNSNAHFKNISDCTGVNVASKIIEHIKNSLMVIV
ncbi:MAG: ATP-grasp domain-containing protein [Clostridia bacterium]